MSGVACAIAWLQTVCCHCEFCRTCASRVPSWLLHCPGRVTTLPRCKAWSHMIHVQFSGYEQCTAAVTSVDHAAVRSPRAPPGAALPGLISRSVLLPVRLRGCKQCAVTVSSEGLASSHGPPEYGCCKPWWFPVQFFLKQIAALPCQLCTCESHCVLPVWFCGGKQCAITFASA